MLKVISLFLEWSKLFALQPPLRMHSPALVILDQARKYLPSIVLSIFTSSCYSMISLVLCNQCKWLYFASEEILSSRSLLQLCRACWHMQSINSPESCLWSKFMLICVCVQKSVCACFPRRDTGSINKLQWSPMGMLDYPSTDCISYLN